MRMASSRIFYWSVAILQWPRCSPTTFITTTATKSSRSSTATMLWHVLQRRPFDLVLVLSLHVPWTMRPSSYSATWRIDFANAILFLKHLRAVHSPPPQSSSPGVCSRRRRKRLWPTVRSPLSPNPSTWPNLTVSCYWLLRAEKAIDDMTRAEHIAVVPFSTRRCEKVGG